MNDDDEDGGRRLIKRHDQFAKYLLDQPGIADAFLRERLPAAVSANLSDAVAVDRSESFVDAALRERRGDRVYSLGTRAGDPLLAWAVVEHKSQPDGNALPQLLTHVSGAAVKGAVRRVLPDGGVWMVPIPVFAIILYHGTRKWSLPTRLLDAYGVPEGMTEAGLLDFRYVLIDLETIADDDLSRHPDLQAGLLVLKYAGHDADPRETLERLLTIGAGAGLMVVMALVRYLFLAADSLDRAHLKMVLGRIVPEESEMIMSNALREYMAEARAEGVLVGEAKGKAEGKAEMLLRLLGRRFGPLPPETANRIRAASIEELDRWAETIFDARTLDAVFAEVRQPNH
ncbi:hypothetical protein N825_02055 [Skermanella stibiiresistens SB22]|uniref:Transposase n=1 Tax=Skermanella stibiiresistens SB22 TaxID=1385369 RepID=W9HG26_9PROT|nr:Rpn family recombination-promoting nuclease/putative transposase [Skermanella stibiiresistens]EWY42863.1 hypothetical protein N825_02055 [Skermanella stibiiresistens SB22]